MSVKIITRICARALSLFSILFLIPTIVSLIYGEYSDAVIFAIVGIGTACISIPFTFLKKNRNDVYTREGMAIAALLWILISAVGALPFTISGVISNYVDAYFETVSGLTTTGVSILTDVEKLPNGADFPHGMMFWRCFTHWVGGMGIIVLAIAVMPSSNSSLVLIQAESPGPEAGKLVPKSKKSSAILYLIYTFLSLVTFILLRIGGMPIFDCFCNTFSIAGTGGFSNHNAGISYYNSVYIEIVTTIMMAVFGVNFTLYYYILIKRFKEVRKNTELKVYIGIMLVVMAMITCNTYKLYGNVWKTLRYSTFMVSSAMTSTGYANADYNAWPMFSKSLIILLMVIGACAGSTGGGFKVQRIVILIKSAYRSIKKITHPNAVTIVKSDGRTISMNTVHGTSQYFIIYMLIAVFSIILVSLDNYDFQTTVSSVFTCFNNIGIIVSEEDSVSNLANFSYFSKIIFILDMLLGRLELLPIIILFLPKAWKNNF